MSTKKPKSTAVQMPDDPDPTPIAASDTTVEVQGAARATKKKMAQSYGRQQTILAGNTNQNQGEKKTILGG